MTMSAAILYSAVCVCDVMSKAGQQSVSVMSWARPAPVAEVSNTSLANIFLVFVDIKAQSNVAVAWQAQVQNEKMTSSV